MAIIKASGEQPTVIEYPKTSPTLEQLRDLLSQMKQQPLEHKKLKREEAGMTDKELFKVMDDRPILINRPIVET